MNLALVADDNKKALMENLCIAYRHILSKHILYATATTGRLVEEATGLPVHKFLTARLGGEEQLGAQIAYNAIDMVIYLYDPYHEPQRNCSDSSILHLCDVHNIPAASNQATAEALLLALDRGDLNWREVVK